MTSPLYFIEVETVRQGRWFLEVDRERNCRAFAIQLANEWRGHVVTVLAVWEDEHTCRNVTEEIVEAANVAYLERTE